MRRFLEQEGLPLLVLAAWVASLAVRAPSFVAQDTWLALVDGREVARHGLPHRDTLTVWTYGRTWIDQQWGAHLLLYELERLGGIQLVLLVGILVPAAMLGLLWLVARRLGGSPRSTALALLPPILAAPWLLQVRTQTLALLPFVAVYGLLAADARRPGRRVLWTLPVLVLWANLHGSVALGAGLVALRGLWLLPPAEGRTTETRLRGLALVVLAPLSLLASPYGGDLVAYYRLMLLRPPLAHYVTEWQPVDAEWLLVPFFVTAAVAIVLWLAARRAVTPFERVALPILLLAACLAVRNAIWFELALVVSAPRLLDAVHRPSVPTAGVRRLNSILGPAAAVAAAALVVLEVAGPDPAFQRKWSPAAAAAVASAAGPHGLVLADDVHADWLLWREPALAGRILYDVRFELFGGPQLHELSLLRRGDRPAWRSCAAGVAVATFAGRHDEAPVRRAGLLTGARTVVRSPWLVAVAVPPRGRQSGSACRTMPPST